MATSPQRSDRYGDDRLGRLEAATERLSQNVVGLSTSLAIVTEISQRQTDIEATALNAVQQALDAAKDATSAKEDVLTVQEARKRSQFGFVVFAVVVLAILAYIRYESVAQISERNRVSYRVCENTNARVELQAEIVRRAGDARDAQRLRAQEIDCKKEWGPQNDPSFLGG